MWKSVPMCFQSDSWSCFTIYISFFFLGSFGNIHESSSLHKGQCSLSQSNLTQNWPSCKNSTPELDNGKPNIRRTHTSVALQDCRPHSSVTRASSTPQTEMARRNLDHKSRCEQHLVSGSTEHVTEDNAQITCTQKRPPPLNLRHSDVNRNEARLPPPYPGSLKQGASQPHRSPVFSAEQALWRLPRSETVVGTSLARTQPPEQSVQNRQMSLKSPANNQNSKTLTDPDWQEWQRERWQIWELLSTDNPDTLPETLVWWFWHNKNTNANITKGLKQRMILSKVIFLFFYTF